MATGAAWPSARSSSAEHAVRLARFGSRDERVTSGIVATGTAKISTHRLLVGSLPRRRDVENPFLERWEGLMIKLMFADDEELVRASLRGMMSGAPDIEVVGEASDGRSAVEAARRLAPDVALLDIKMREPDDGIRALRAILALPSPPTVAM